MKGIGWCLFKVNIILNKKCSISSFSFGIFFFWLFREWEHHWQSQVYQPQPELSFLYLVGVQEFALAMTGISWGFNRSPQLFDSAKWIEILPFTFWAYCENEVSDVLVDGQNCNSWLLISLDSANIHRLPFVELQISRPGGPWSCLWLAQLVCFL